MAVAVKPSELIKRIAYRYYPMVAMIWIPTSYIIKILYFPALNITQVYLIGNAGSIYLWLILILSLYFIKPVGFIKKVLVMAVSYSIGFLIPFIGFVLYFNFDLSPFSGSPISSRIVLITLMFGFFLIGILILVERSLIVEKTYIEEKTERMLSEKELMKNQLSLLQARVEPQFLFATMERISNLFDTAPDKAKQIQMYFIKYLRATLMKAREPVTTIGQEMEFIRSYLDIIKIGMTEGFEYQIEMDPLTKDLQFPSMLIQPVVEHAIKQTINNNTKGNRISISVQKQEERIHVKTTSTGDGLYKAEWIETNLEDVKKRITSLFGDKSEFRIEENRPSELSVIIEVPCG